MPRWWCHRKTCIIVHKMCIRGCFRVFVELCRGVTSNGFPGYGGDSAGDELQDNGIDGGIK